jgi:hypothetical protein
MLRYGIPMMSRSRLKHDHRGHDGLQPLRETLEPSRSVFLEKLDIALRLRAARRLLQHLSRIRVHPSASVGSQREQGEDGGGSEAALLGVVSVHLSISLDQAAPRQGARVENALWEIKSEHSQWECQE